MQEYLVEYDQHTHSGWSTNATFFSAVPARRNGPRACPDDDTAQRAALGHARAVNARPGVRNLNVRVFSRDVSEWVDREFRSKEAW